jgi:hypothetical protein
VAAQREALRDALLVLGLEDQIPLPEAIEDHDVQAAANPQDLVGDLGRTLTALAAEGRVVFYRGRWDDNDPPQLSRDEAAALLSDERWYRWRADEPDADRLYFMNVDNLAKQ